MNKLMFWKKKKELTTKEKDFFEKVLFQLPDISVEGTTISPLITGDRVKKFRVVKGPFYSRIEVEFS